MAPLLFEHVIDAPLQVSLLVSASTTSACVTLGYGLNATDMPKENLPKMPFIAVFAGFFSVLSAAWSKTSFGLTLLRLCQGWTKWVIWFIIVTVNLILGTAMLLMWVKCHPFAKVWDDRIEGWCINPKNIVTFYQWSAGEFPTESASQPRIGMADPRAPQAGLVLPTSSLPSCPGPSCSTCAKPSTSRNGLALPLL